MSEDSEGTMADDVSHAQQIEKLREKGGTMHV